MGFLDEIVGKGLGALTGKANQGSSMICGVLGLLNDPKVGGLSGLLQGFRDQGMGKIVDSWISVGKNLPISGDQIQKALDPQILQGLASKAGIDVGQAAGQLAQALPGIIDKLTPQGSIPDASVVQKGLDLLKSQMGNK